MHVETCAKHFADQCRAHLHSEHAQTNLFKDQEAHAVRHLRDMHKMELLRAEEQVRHSNGLEQLEKDKVIQAETKAK